MFEAVIAGIIILGFLAVVSQSYISAPQEDITLQAYQSLRTLDEQGKLRAYVQAGDWGAINDGVMIFSRNHTVQICSPSGCQGGTPDGPSVWAGSYMIAGNDYFAPKQVKLYLW
jgi:hypothetical protein